MKLLKSFTFSLLAVSYISAVDLPILKTGITTSEISGDDGDYQAGKSRSYTRDDNLEVVIDNSTGLMWQDNSDAKEIKKDWQGAIDYCEDLTFASFSDWRLPTRMELKSIVDYGRYNPAIDSTFQNIQSSYYWSSSRNVSNTDSAWLVDFYDGNGNWGHKSGSNYVRCVRTN